MKSTNQHMLASDHILSHPLYFLKLSWLNLLSFALPARIISHHNYYTCLHTSCRLTSYFQSIFFFLKISFIFRQRGREGEREGGKHQCVVASPIPPTGDLALKSKHVPYTGNWTSDLSVHKLALNPLSHTSQGSIYFVSSYYCPICNSY